MSREKFPYSAISSLPFFMRIKGWLASSLSTFGTWKGFCCLLFAGVFHPFMPFEGSITASHAYKVWNGWVIKGKMSIHVRMQAQCNHMCKVLKIFHWLHHRASNSHFFKREPRERGMEWEALHTAIQFWPIKIFIFSLLCVFYNGPTRLYGCIPQTWENFPWHPLVRI